MGLTVRQRLVSPAVKRPYRVVVAKPGLDGHDRGAKVIARALRDAGFEVIYTGLHQTADQVVQAVIQEDADAVGLSLLSGAHLTLVPRVIDGLREQGRDDVLVLVGGIIPEGDIPVLKEMGVAEVFTPGAPLPAIGTWLGEALDERPRPSATHAKPPAWWQRPARSQRRTSSRTQTNHEPANKVERNGSSGSL
jgi:methylmalonyl-CoA mutase C-terminal domain/subunit